MMFFLKAVLMMLIPFYRVDLESVNILQKVTYQVFVNGQLQTQLLLDNNQVSILKNIFEKEKRDWKYDLATYIPSRRYVAYGLQINIVGNLVVLNDESIGQISKEFSASHLNKLEKEVEKYRDVVNAKISKDGKYKIEWISFDTTFFTPTDYSNFESRIESRFDVNSVSLDKMFRTIESSCSLNLGEYEPRVHIQAPDGNELIITYQRDFITFKKACSYPTKLTLQAIEDIEKGLSISIRRKAMQDPVPQYAPIYN
jgi:hypothetical protein